MSIASDTISAPPLADHAPRYRIERSTPASRIGTVAALILLGLLAALPFWAERGTMRLLVEFFYYVSLASLWNLLAGYAGLVSVGQQAFVGLGGYALFGVSAFLGFDPVLALPVAGLAAAIPQSRPPFSSSGSAAHILRSAPGSRPKSIASLSRNSRCSAAAQA